MGWLFPAGEHQHPAALNYSSLKQTGNVALQGKGTPGKGLLASQPELGLDAMDEEGVL